MKKKVNKIQKTPFGVHVVSTIYYIFGILSILGGAMFLFAGVAGEAILSKFTPEQIISAGMFGAQSLGDVLIGETVTKSLMIFALFPLALGIFNVLIARSLNKGESWGRAAAMTLAVIWFFASVVTFAWFGILFNGIIGAYLIFNKKVQAHYN